jgi:hypothetical protein
MTSRRNLDEAYSAASSDMTSVSEPGPAHAKKGHTKWQFVIRPQNNISAFKISCQLLHGRSIPDQAVTRAVQRVCCLEQAYWMTNDELPANWRLDVAG